MTDVVYPPLAARSPGRRRELAQESTGPSTRSALVFADGALPERTRQLIAVTVAHVTRCHYCIAGHAKLAHHTGASDAQIMEAIWVAAEIRAGGAFAHSTVALHALSDGRQ